MQFLRQQPDWNAINIGTGKGRSVLEVIRAFEQASGREVPYEIRPRRPGDVATSCASARKASDPLGWRSSRGLDDMCASMWKWCAPQ